MQRHYYLQLLVFYPFPFTFPRLSAMVGCVAPMENSVSYSGVPQGRAQMIVAI